MTDAEALELALEAARAAQAAAERAATAAQAAAENTANSSVSWLQLVDRLPVLLLTVSLILFVIWNFRRLDAFFDRVSGVKAFGFEMELGLSQDLARAAGAFDDIRITKTFKGGERVVRITIDDRTRALKRASDNLVAIKGRRVLWLDDRQENNSNEIDLLEKLGVVVTTVQDNQSALDLLENAVHPFDALLSDIERSGDSCAGVGFLEILRKKGVEVPVIFYISELDRTRPAPVGCFGITNRPDELLHLIIDLFERTRPLV